MTLPTLPNQISACLPGTFYHVLCVCCGTLKTLHQIYVFLLLLHCIIFLHCINFTWIIVFLLFWQISPGSWKCQPAQSGQASQGWRGHPRQVRRKMPPLKLKEVIGVRLTKFELEKNVRENSENDSDQGQDQIGGVEVVEPG